MRDDDRVFSHALVLGKFYPPHSGHHRLIRAAAARSRRTTVAVLGAAVESVPLADRVRWLADEHAADAGVTIIGDVDDHPIDFHDDATWDLHMGVVRSVLGRRAIADGDPSQAVVDAVFSSEDYGAELASRLDAKHVLVDLDRTVVPVWCERYLGVRHPEVDTDRRPTSYLLTDHVGVSFEQDGWRDGEHRREWMTARFAELLAARGVPWVKLTGSHPARLRAAVAVCDDVLARHFQFNDPLTA
jgi:hypothetical protein